jgi:hypothetical protein
VVSAGVVLGGLHDRCVVDSSTPHMCSGRHGFVAERQRAARPSANHLFIHCGAVPVVTNAGADLLPGATGTAIPSTSSRAGVDTPCATAQKRQQQQQQQQQQSSKSSRKAAVEYAAIVTIPPGVVPGQAMQVQLADGRCVVVQVCLQL